MLSAPAGSVALDRVDLCEFANAGGAKSERPIVGLEKLGSNRRLSAETRSCARAGSDLKPCAGRYLPVWRIKGWIGDLFHKNGRLETAHRTGDRRKP